MLMPSPVDCVETADQVEETVRNRLFEEIRIVAPELLSDLRLEFGSHGLARWPPREPRRTIIAPHAEDPAVVELPKCHIH
jgi:hypothetical protein